MARGPGDMIGPYRIVRILGRGGMGEVYLCARADDHYRQQVAIKLVNADLMSRQVSNRLRTERQILAGLDHPNIARLLDGGATEEGVPYLVLEYIDGEPIDRYCDRRKLGITERLQLFRKVCSAVQAAHRALIVHRDLKPSNILVTADGTPKLLDFGIAKLLEVQDTAHTMALTQADIRVLTPDYASPEQVRGDLVTTACDVYVLGALLYQLLCGKRPFVLTGMPLREVEKVICEQLPLPPSQRLKEVARYSSGEAERVAGERGVTAVRLRRQLAGDLDNIVMMAMRTEAPRRYGSVDQLSGDLEHFLAGRPVLARRDTWSYRTRKFLNRHAVAATAAALFLVMLTGFAMTMFVQAGNLRRERDLVTAQRALAEAERARAQSVSEFLVDAFQRSDPSESRGEEMTAREILERGARRVATELKQQPATQATLMEAMGRVYLRLGSPDRALPLLEDALKLRREVHGERHPITGAGMRSLAEAKLAQGELVAAERLLRQALAIQLSAGDHKEQAAVLHALARVLLERGELEAAAQMYGSTIRKMIKLHGPRHTGVTSLQNELAAVMLSRGNYAEAERLYEQALATDRQLLGSDHPQVMHDVSGLAWVLQVQGKLAEAEPLFKESVALSRRVMGPEHPDTLRIASNYGYFLQARGELAAAEQTAREVLELERKVRGPAHYYVGYDLVDLAGVLYARGDYPQSTTLYLQALEIYRKTLPDTHPYVAAALTGLARSHAERDRYDESGALVEKAVGIWLKQLPQDHWQVASSRAVLGRCAARRGAFAEAEPLLLASYAALEKQRGAGDLNTRRVRAWLADLYTGWNKQEQAARYR